MEQISQYVSDVYNKNSGSWVRGIQQAQQNYQLYLGKAQTVPYIANKVNDMGLPMAIDNKVYKYIMRRSGELLNRYPTPLFGSDTVDGRGIFSEKTINRVVEYLNRILNKFWKSSGAMSKTITAFELGMIQGYGVLKICPDPVGLTIDTYTIEQCYIDYTCIEKDMSDATDIQFISIVKKSDLIQRYPEHEAYILRSQPSQNLQTTYSLPKPINEDYTTILEHWTNDSAQFGYPEGTWIQIVTINNGETVLSVDQKAYSNPFCLMYPTVNKNVMFVEDKFRGVITDVYPLQQTYNQLLLSLLRASTTSADGLCLIKTDALMNPDAIEEGIRSGFLPIKGTADLRDSVYQLPPAQISETILGFMKEVQTCISSYFDHEDYASFKGGAHPNDSASFQGVKREKAIEGNARYIHNFEETVKALAFKLVDIVLTVVINENTDMPPLIDDESTFVRVHDKSTPWYNLDKIRALVGCPDLDIATLKLMKSVLSGISLTLVESGETLTQRGRHAELLLTLKQAGINIPDKDIIKRTPVSNTQGIIENMESGSGVQMQELQLRLERKIALIENEKADVQLKLAQAEEKLSKAMENMAKAEQISRETNAIPSIQ